MPTAQDWRVAHHNRAPWQFLGSSCGKRHSGRGRLHSKHPRRRAQHRTNYWWPASHFPLQPGPVGVYAEEADGGMVQERGRARKSRRERDREKWKERKAAHAREREREFVRASKGETKRQRVGGQDKTREQVMEKKRTSERDSRERAGERDTERERQRRAPSFKISDAVWNGAILCREKWPLCVVCKCACVCVCVVCECVCVRCDCVVPSEREAVCPNSRVRPARFAAEKSRRPNWISPEYSL